MGQRGANVWGLVKWKEDFFSLPYSDCFPSVLPHCSQCRCCRRRLRWECHKWPETNVGLPHPTDLQHSPKPFCFLFFLFFINLRLSPVLLFPTPNLTALQFLKSSSCHQPQYLFNSSCFPISPFLLSLHLSRQIMWKRRSIFHLSTMVNQSHQARVIVQMASSRMKLFHTIVLCMHMCVSSCGSVNSF